MASLGLREDAGWPQRLAACQVVVRGAVQGVGFRPFLYNLARKHELAGRVRNTAAGVSLFLEGKGENLRRFLEEMERHPPRLARIDEVVVSPAEPVDLEGFAIESSSLEGARQILVLPDVAVCPRCLAEIRDVSDRRYGYPFTNCTDCGPRYTIIADLPYDRERTSMRGFTMCAECRREYEDYGDRRFHAQPNACPSCGPRARMFDDEGRALPGDPFALFRRLVDQGQVVAVKGLGGFHLACRADSRPALAHLRREKPRPCKPLAVMARDVEAARKYCRVSPEEEAMLTSFAAPIVLLLRRPEAGLPEELAPGLPSLGVMLPYTPLHNLLFGEGCDLLVMTSGNRAGLPLARDDGEALRQLKGIARYFLSHDRPILNRVDDSVVRLVESGPLILRRARGYAPAPVEVPVPAGVGEEGRGFLGVGGDMHNTFCYLRGRQAFLSPHIGDIENLEMLDHLEATIRLYENWFEAAPAAVGFDLHPAYLTGSFCRQRFGGATLFGVQHHHAHMASCMAEAGLTGPAIGIVCDGTGYGPDGTLWGAEILYGDYGWFSREAHVSGVWLPGGESAVKSPWRTAVAYICEYLDEAEQGEALELLGRPVQDIQLCRRMLQGRVNCPRANGLGRLFDAVSALAGVCQENTYEGQAAQELGEMLTGRSAEAEGYPHELRRTGGGLVMSPAPLLAGVVRDLKKGAGKEVVAARFHNGLVEMLAAAAQAVATERRCRRAVLSGGVFQNPYLLSRLSARLREAGLEVHGHRQVPANDGGLSLGQAVVAAWRCAAARGRGD